jgi:hypothetical protein
MVVLSLPVLQRRNALPLGAETGRSQSARRSPTPSFVAVISQSRLVFVGKLEAII